MRKPQNMDLVVAILMSGKSKDEVAKEAGIERGTLRRMICGIGSPSLAVVQRVVKVLGGTAESLGFFPK